MPPATANFATRENRCRSRETSDHNNNPMPPIRLAHRRGSASRCPDAGLGRTRRFQIEILTAQKNHWQPVSASDCPRVFAPYLLAHARTYSAESRGLSLRHWERVPAFHVGDFVTTPPRRTLGSAGSSSSRCRLPAIAPVPDRRVFGCHKGGRGLAHRIGASTVRAIFR